MDWEMFFPAGTRVIALPSWRNPRLYLPTQRIWQRWEQSSLYPASRSRARLYRLSLRARAAARITEARTARSSPWLLAEFTEGMLSEVASVVVLTGTPSTAQHFTVQLWDEKGRVLGYLKYGESDAARMRLRREWFMIENIPPGVGPEALKYGDLGNGEALLKNALPGKPLPTSLPPPEALIDLLDSFVTLPAVSTDAHPWVRRIRQRGAPEVDAWLEPLAARKWPVAVQHGDFAPWNLLRAPDGRVMAVDWEYGALNGLPLLDLAYYLLQTLALIHREDPLAAARYTAAYLSGQPSLSLTDAEARALIRLAVYDAYLKSLEDGQPPDSRLQEWRRAIWKNGVQEA